MINEQPANNLIKRKIRDALKIPSELRLNKFSAPRRKQSIEEAKSWPKGLSQSSKTYQNLYVIGENKVCLGKPGKEAAPDYKQCTTKDGVQTNNPNDMFPVIFLGQNRLRRSLTFEDMFGLLLEMGKKSEFALELMGSLLVRNAFMLDHKETEPGIWRLSPPTVVIDRIRMLVPEVGEIPLDVLLYFTDVIALNEDVKYSTLGYDTVNQAYGRRNTLLTFAHLTAVLLKRASLARFAGSFARPPPGIAALSMKKALEAFPLLSETTETMKSQTKRLNSFVED
ncbi:MAG: hypothetical protein ACFFBS_04785 [Promethearchaeota archaeon]